MSEHTIPRTLIYKRTHPGDPNPDGVFGCEDCMGSVRARMFGAVIGLGGTSSEPRYFGMNGRLNWVGVGAQVLTHRPFGYRGPLITFEHFLLLEDKGPMLNEIAPALARYVYATHRRVVMSDNLSPVLRGEIDRILQFPRRINRNVTSTIMTRRRFCLPRPCKKRIC